ncbi:hypothetical protein BDW72DRAFT_209062 [Aspergillus terricola var. indicus]
MDPLPATEHLLVERHGAVFTITLQKPPENRLTMKLCQTLIETYRWVERQLNQTADPEGAVIIQGKDDRYFTTGLDLDERETIPFASTDGFYPLLKTILDFPFPTICPITGHTFGDACLLTLAHDYRIMNATRGFWCMPPVNLGLHFDGWVARKVLLEAYRFTGVEALEHGIVDLVAPPAEMRTVARELAESVKARSKMGVYSLLRGELSGGALRDFMCISGVHGREVSRQPRVKL